MAALGQFHRVPRGGDAGGWLKSTRPIEFPVERPEEAAGMFDVLTYEKGRIGVAYARAVSRRG